jgi:hypothetical protein
VPNVSLARRLLWMHLVQLLGDVGHGESCFGQFGEVVSFGAR